MEPRPEVSKARAVAAWAVFALAMLMALAAIGLLILNAGSVEGGPPTIFFVPGFGLVGAIVTSRSRNAIGPLFLGLSVTGATTALAFAYAGYGVITAPGSLPLPLYAGAISSLGFPMTFLLLGLVLLLFPNGQVPSRRWRPIRFFLIFTGGVAAASALFSPTIYLGESDAAAQSNPLGLPLPGFLPSSRSGWLILMAWYAVFFCSLALALAAPIVRRRKASPETRQQLRLLSLALSGVLVLIALAVPLMFTEADTAVGVLVLLMAVMIAVVVPAAIGIAILKYHLYDIDLVVKKTVVLGLLAVFIVVTYAGVVAVVLATVSFFSWGSDTAPFLAAVVLALLFQPARVRAQRIADRLVYGQRATPYEVLTEFSGTVGDTYAAEAVLPRMAEVLAAGTGAHSATVWLHVGNSMRAEATWPEDAAHITELPEGSTEVRHQGELLGALSVQMPLSDPMNPAKAALVQDLASQAGLVLRNVRLIDDLRSSRQRLVAAQDEERRKIERNLHDGAQQQLIALAIKVNLAQTLTERDPDKAKEMMQQVKGELQEAVETLRDLARGIYPPLLSDQGLGAALAAQARKAAAAVSVEDDGVGRYPQDIEAAAYFCCLEALQNIAKHAGAQNTVIHLSRPDGALTFTVRDDGAGFDTSEMTYGTGLQGMADRLDAIGGSLAIESAPGAGTTVTGSIPGPAD